MAVTSPSAAAKARHRHRHRHVQRDCHFVGTPTLIPIETPTKGTWGCHQNARLDIVIDTDTYNEIDDQVSHGSQLQSLLRL